MNRDPQERRAGVGVGREDDQPVDMPAEECVQVVLHPDGVAARIAEEHGHAATAVAGWFDAEPDLRFEPFERFAELTEPEHAAATWEHIARSPSASIEKARRLLGYEPAYTSLRAAAEALHWLIEDGQVETGGRGVPERYR